MLPPLRVFSPLSPVLSPSRTIKLSGSTENRKASRSQRAPRVSSNVKPISSDAQPLIDRDTPTFSEFHRRQNLLGNFVAISETSFETLVGFSKQLANWNLVDSLGGGRRVRRTRASRGYHHSVVLVLDIKFSRIKATLPSRRCDLNLGTRQIPRLADC